MTNPELNSLPTENAISIKELFNEKNKTVFIKFPEEKKNKSFISWKT